MKKMYVLGFAFSEDKSHVVLIKKLRPEWQKGSFNGVGGKVEKSDKDIYLAMTREFEEETGLKTEVENWHNFADMVFEDDIMGGGAVVHCFRMFNEKMFECKTTEEEEIQIFCIDQNTKSEHPSIYGSGVIKNLLVLIPMAKDEDFEFCTLNIN
ncbi:MAG: NUDIX domain-containing protein [Bacteroidota bacterium]